MEANNKIKINNRIKLEPKRNLKQLNFSRISFECLVDLERPIVNVGQCAPIVVKSNLYKSINPNFQRVQI